MISASELKANISLLLKEGFAEFKPVWLRLLGAGAAIFVGLFSVLALELTLLGLGGGFAEKPNFLMYFFMPVVIILHMGMIVFGNCLQAAYIRICLKMVRKEEFSVIHEFKQSYKLLLPLFLGVLCALPVIILGFICFVIPGFYLASRFSLFAVAVADGCGPIEALHKSFRITRGHVLEIVAMVLLAQLVLFASVLLPILNLIAYVFFALPFVQFLTAFYYVKLETSAGSEQIESGTALNAGLA